MDMCRRWVSAALEPMLSARAHAFIPIVLICVWGSDKAVGNVPVEEDISMSATESEVAWKALHVATVSPRRDRMTTNVRPERRDGHALFGVEQSVAALDGFRLLRDTAQAVHFKLRDAVRESRLHEAHRLRHAIPRGPEGDFAL